MNQCRIPMAQDLHLTNAAQKQNKKNHHMRTIGILVIAALFFAGCKKSEKLPTLDGPGKNVKTIEFSVTTDSLNFTIPIEALSGATEITAKGKITTSLSPECSSYVVLSVGDSVVWHSSFMEASVDFSTSDIRNLVRSTGVDCKLEFFNLTDVHGPFKCAGFFIVTYYGK